MIENVEKGRTEKSHFHTEKSINSLEAKNQVI